MARDESLRRGREFVNRLLVVSGLVVLGVIVWANWGPGAPVAMPTMTPTPVARPTEEAVVSFGQVRLCGLARFGEQGVFVFCPQGETEEPFKPEMLAGKDSVGLDPNNLLEPRWWARPYNGLLVPFNASDLPVR